MYKNLNTVSLGILARQSELIEMALTHRFQGLDVDIVEMQRRTAAQGVQQTRKFLESAKLRVGGFELPLNWTSDEPSFQKELQQIAALVTFAKDLGATVACTYIQPANDELPFHQNFELHRRRLRDLGEMLEKYDMRLAVGFLAAPARRIEHNFQFIYQPDQTLLLLRTVGAANVGLLLDTWNWTVGGGTMEQITNLTASQVVAVRLADAPAGFDPNSVAEDERYLPGETGTTDLVAVLSHLTTIGFDGPVTIYPDAKRFANQKRDTVVQQIAALLEEKWPAAGLATTAKLATVGAGQ